MGHYLSYFQRFFAFFVEFWRCFDTIWLILEIFLHFLQHFSQLSKLILMLFYNKIVKILTFSSFFFQFCISSIQRSLFIAFFHCVLARDYFIIAWSKPKVWQKKRRKFLFFVFDDFHGVLNDDGEKWILGYILSKLLRPPPMMTWISKVKDLIFWWPHLKAFLAKLNEWIA